MDQAQDISVPANTTHHQETNPSTNLFELASRLGKIYDGDTQDGPGSEWASSEDAILPEYHHSSEKVGALARARSRRAGRPSFLRRHSSKHTGSTQLSPFHYEEYENKRTFTLRLIKVLLDFGSPSYRIQQQAAETAKALQISAGFQYLPGVMIISLGHGELTTRETIPIRSKSDRIALSPLQHVHAIYRRVMHREMSLTEGAELLDRLLKPPPPNAYDNALKSLLAFVTAGVICLILFSGSFLDMLAAGFCAGIIKFFGLLISQNAEANENSYEVATAIGMSFLTSALSSIPGRYFCYTAVSSAAAVQILPGFTILMAAMDLSSKNIVSGAIQMVYALVYTLFLGYGLSGGCGAFYDIFSKAAKTSLAESVPPPPMSYYNGFFTAYNGSNAGVPIHATFGYNPPDATLTNVIGGCYRSPDMPWYMQTAPGWLAYLLVPIFVVCIAKLHEQKLRSPRVIGMILFASCTHVATAAGTYYLPSQTGFVAAIGAFTIGILGNLYSRTTQGSSFVMMVPSVLFLIPCALAYGGGGFAPGYSPSEENVTFEVSFSLALRMIQVAVGVAFGLLCSQMVVYMLDTRKNKEKGHRNLFFAF